MTKRFVALARVSSREQEREGFSLDVQEEAIKRYVVREHGELVRFFRIAETASKREQRKTFKEVLAYAKAHAHELAGVLFYKVDRAARNIFDYVELERLEADDGLAVVYVAQPTENTPAGRMQRRILANMASFYTEQQSLDVREGHQRRVPNGLFVGSAPYGYRNVRIDGRGLIEVDHQAAEKVRRIFHLYAYRNHTLDSLGQALATECVTYRPGQPRFSRSKLHNLLRDRAYIGEVFYGGQWHPGKQEPLVDRETWDRVQVLLGGRIYHAHELTYAGSLVTCGHCGRPITGESKVKRTKAGEREYIYYRCAKYCTDGHPRVRVLEREFDTQVVALFRKMRIEDETVRDWVQSVLRAKVRENQEASKTRTDVLRRELGSLDGQRDRLLNLRLNDEIEGATFAAKDTELRDRAAQVRLQLEACDRGQSENAELAIKAFELSQRLEEKWLVADYDAKRQILEIICLNLTLDGVTLVPTMRKPFDVLAEGLVSDHTRGDKI